MEIDESQLRDLDRLAKQHCLPRATLIREAVADYLQKRSEQTIDNAFGLWGDRRIDGLDYQERVRREW